LDGLGLPRQKEYEVRGMEGPLALFKEKAWKFWAPYWSVYIYIYTPIIE
jgi:hypothetical protein